MKIAVEQIQVCPQKLLVKMWMTKELMAKARSLEALTLDANQKKDAMVKAVQDAMGSTSLIKAQIVNLGPGLNTEMGYEVGKFVYVFPRTFDADFIIDEVGYYIYSERNILAVLNETASTEEEDNEKPVIETNVGDKGPSSIILN